MRSTNQRYFRFAVRFPVQTPENICFGHAAQSLFVFVCFIEGTNRLDMFLDKMSTSPVTIKYILTPSQFFFIFSPEVHLQIKLCFQKVLCRVFDHTGFFLMVKTETFV